MILAREAGYSIEKEDVIINKFLPDECFKGDLNDFFNKVKEYDAEFEKNLHTETKKKKPKNEITNLSGSTGTIK